MVKKIFDNKPLSERFFKFMKTMFISFYPDAYHELVNKNLGDAIKYLSNIILFSLIILSVLLIFNIFTLKGSLSSELTKLENLDITTSLNEPIIFENNNIIIANEANYTNENLLITSKQIIRKPTLCAILKPTCWFSKKPIITEYSDLEKNTKDLTNFILFVVILMFPGLLILYLIYILIKSILIILLISSIAYLITKIIKYKITYKKTVMIAIFSSTILIIGEPVNLVFINLYYIHVILFVILFTINMILISEKKHRY